MEKQDEHDEAKEWQNNQWLCQLFLGRHQEAAQGHPLVLQARLKENRIQPWRLRVALKPKEN